MILPKEPQNSDALDLFRSRLEQIVDMSHPLAKLAGVIDWGFLEESFGDVYTDAPGSSPLPTRLDEALCDRWTENPYYKLFCGKVFSSIDRP